MAIVNYFVWEADRYDFTVSGLNPYTRSILEQSMRGWPGGLRWLHGEDESTRARPFRVAWRRVAKPSVRQASALSARSARPRWREPQLVAQAARSLGHLGAASRIM